jgi:hypothetical protein
MSGGTPSTGAPGAGQPAIGGPITSDPLFTAVIGKFPPLGTNFPDDDRISLLHLLVASMDLIYHQSQETIAVTQPPPAPAPAPTPAPSPAPSNGSSSGTTSPSTGS